ncbi:hypothetical protein GTA62_00010 [Roseobacter sp. HKCCD9010]|uniref:hypothetical protein n=1 Tax=unclassified Roseobacter TaxID=196798 RepID=UPI0014920F3C|nr:MULTISPECIES: hypothetical protein [unclassified Roseobacter]MBF9049754.1 hypothetical protein [Rhodobacterales bacterium HKCCD4356]NNV11754.1 hypothetical protein [Roseobacter sp. HKCCD7357]NNV15938.1 hypothetical protein [Roseobacter sp. HKCCD8768]NNV25398.1 hypothetical protein [Roseobacter sp. HKCCD8192]NNV29655.1 hypothetical protein [Roseobacter sp. HKCCD9061]
MKRENPEEAQVKALADAFSLGCGWLVINSDQTEEHVSPKDVYWSCDDEEQNKPET